MERVIRKHDSGDIACNDTIIYSKDKSEIGKVLVGIYDDWIIIEPEYYIYDEDNVIVEIWHDSTGILIDIGLAKYLKIGMIAKSWSCDKRIKISYEKAMGVLEIEARRGIREEDDSAFEIDCEDDDKLDAMAFCYYGTKHKNETNERKFPFWLKVISGNERPIGTIFYVKNELIRYKKEDVELYTGYIPSFTEDDLIDKFRGTKEHIGWEKLNYQLRGIKEQSKEKDYILEDDKIKNDYLSGKYVSKNDLDKLKKNNNGGASDWYELPKDANTLQDLIEHRNMNGSVKDIFKACYRLGIKTEDELRDLNKMAYYSLREIGRISSRKDYIAIAKELMGSQTIEKE